MILKIDGVKTCLASKQCFNYNFIASYNAMLRSEDIKEVVN